MSGSQLTLFLIYIATSLLLDTLAIFLNGLVAYVLEKHKKARFATFWFVFCLSTSDVMVSTASLVYNSLWLKGSLVSGNLSSNAGASFIFKSLHYLFEISVQLVLTIAVDRYVHTKY